MLSIPHLIVIFIVVLVVFGPEKLPELARNFGKVMAEFRRATGDLRNTFENHMRDLERETEERRIGANRAAATLAAVPAQPAASPAVPPGTVTANPPHAAAIAAAGSGETEAGVPPGNTEHVDMAPGHHSAIDAGAEPSSAQPYDLPGQRAHEPMHDPYLEAIEADLATAQPPAPPQQPSESETAPETNSERVSDVRNLPA